jgi:alpha-mannosidase
MIIDMKFPRNRHFLIRWNGCCFISIGIAGALFLLLVDGNSVHGLKHESILPFDDVGGDMSSVRKLAATSAPGVLNVHVVPHTHDDVGWRKTVEQYYYGYNTTMERCGSVHAIITTSIQALTENPSRTFTYVEMKFLSMWWYNQTDAMKDTVRFLIANRQLTIVNGGWCMHDEAATHFMGMIDQTTLGHQFLLRELGVKPITGWQLDPFGHSSTHAKLLTYAAGMDALYFGRIDYQDLILRRSESRCEGFWNPSGSRSSLQQGDSTIFWGLTGSYGGNYNPPPGFCFDVLCDDEPLVGANTTRLLKRVVDFLQEIKIQSDQTLDNNIMLTFGEDFTVSA